MTAFVADVPSARAGARRLPVVGSAVGGARVGSACESEGPSSIERDEVRTTRALEVPVRPAWFDAVPARIEDARGRRVTYVRVSVTDRCDLACVYCMPSGGEAGHAPRRELLDVEALARLARLFARSGVERLRFTGGEPLVRKDVVALVAAVHAAAPSLDLALTTNGTRLAALAAPLAAAGLRSVNVSIDSLDADRFATITQGGALDAVLDGARAAVGAGLSVKTNTVLVDEASLDEAHEIVRWAWARGMVPRFIERMPLGDGVRMEGAGFVSASRLVTRLSELVHPAREAGAPSHGPSRYLGARDGLGRAVGVITAMSDEFCAGCNRLRVTARGEVRPCLGSPEGVALMPALEAGADDVELAWRVHAALRTKAAGHGFMDPARDAHRRVGMSLIGG